MTSSEERFESCEACGATIYPEHIQRQSADRWQGKLLCPHCLQEKKHADEPAAAVLPDPVLRIPGEPDMPTVNLVEDDEPADAGDRPSPGPKRSIRAFGVGGTTMGQAQSEEIQYRRPLRRNVPYVTRCRTFHSKLNEASLGYLERQINEWVDAHDDIEIKFATSSIGVFEGKHTDPNLIITVFY